MVYDSDDSLDDTKLRDLEIESTKHSSGMVFDHLMVRQVFDLSTLQIYNDDNRVELSQTLGFFPFWKAEQAVCRGHWAPRRKVQNLRSASKPFKEHWIGKHLLCGAL